MIHGEYFSYRRTARGKEEDWEKCAKEGDCEGEKEKEDERAAEC